jgi:hypothetical protein
VRLRIKMDVIPYLAPPAIHAYILIRPMSVHRSDPAFPESRA